MKASEVHPAIEKPGLEMRDVGNNPERQCRMSWTGENKYWFDSTCISFSGPYYMSPHTYTHAPYPWGYEHHMSLLPSHIDTYTHTYTHTHTTPPPPNPLSVGKCVEMGPIMGPVTGVWSGSHNTKMMLDFPRDVICAQISSITHTSTKNILHSAMGRGMGNPFMSSSRRFTEDRSGNMPGKKLGDTLGWEDTLGVEEVVSST
jgi:hypothetical protein